MNKFDIEGLKGEGDKSKQLAAFLPKIKTVLDRWVMFLARYDLLFNENLPNELKVPELKKALDVMESMSFTKEEREAYEDHRKWLMIETNTLKKARADGKIEGKIEVAKSLVSQGYDLKMIMNTTGLSEEEIRAFLPAK